MPPRELRLPVAAHPSTAPAPPTPPTECPQDTPGRRTDCRGIPRHTAPRSAASPPLPAAWPHDTPNRRVAGSTAPRRCSNGAGAVAVRHEKSVQRHATADLQQRHHDSEVAGRRDEAEGVRDVGGEIGVEEQRRGGSSGGSRTRE
eukprot:CAMPEP_0177796102 /NCGR_PEP_ID=MMETSP0491_2-20121128/26599_1 /TAXON_ID=63592 /ORGANISM="Tetraselmis chuii, Strain PLY429" /LENGTH=144 /DNA_ID=CAMNT_0019319001 /DNA_START=268 /DNA_END=703 /DNA_ORIENTATION=+